jgi:hypothetical protein
VKVSVTVFNAQAGDRRVSLDTKRGSNRKKLAQIVAKKQREGAVIFVTWQGDDYRLKSYDQERDELVVHTNRPGRKGPKTFRISATNVEVFVVAPTAGG